VGRAVGSLKYGYGSHCPISWGKKGRLKKTKKREKNSLLHVLVNIFYFADQDFDEPREPRGHDEHRKAIYLLYSATDNTI
jgi:hypothetical protein